MATDVNNNLVKVPAQTLGWATMPPETLLKIFGYLDIKSLGVAASVCQLYAELQVDDEIWNRFIPEDAMSLENESAKDVVFKSSFTIYLENCEHSGGILNLFKKSLNQMSHTPCALLCPQVFQKSYIPNGSFIVYLNCRDEPRVTIKDKAGTVHNCDWQYSNKLCGSAVEELREHEGKPSQFHEFKCILSKEEKALLIQRYCFTLDGEIARMTQVLKGTDL